MVSVTWLVIELELETDLLFLSTRCYENPQFKEYINEKQH